MLHVIFFDFLDLSIKYISNATFGTSLAFQMSVLEIIEKVHVIINQRFGPIEETPCMNIYLFSSSSSVDGENET